MLKMRRRVLAYFIVAFFLRIWFRDSTVNGQFMTSRIRKAPESLAAQKLLKEIMELELPVSGSYKRSHRDGKVNPQYSGYSLQGRMVSSDAGTLNKQQDANCDPRLISLQNQNFCCKNQVWVKCTVLNHWEQERKFNRAWEKYSAQNEMRKISSKLDKMLDQLSSHSAEYSFDLSPIKRRSIANQRTRFGET